jgi:sarcosine oxidase subunit beta
MAKKKKTADVIIIGAGVIGCASAYYLEKKGFDVLVLESSDIIGNGASSRNGGGVRQSGRDVRELPLAMYGISELWPHLSDELGSDVEYHKKGNLRLGKTEKHLKILQGLAEKAQSCGLDMRLIGRKEVKEINPYLSDEVIGATWCPTDGHANPLLVTLAFYREARKLGAVFYTGEKVVGLKKFQGKLRKVETSTSVYEAEHVVLACGLGARPLAKSIGIDIPMKPTLLECLVTEAEPPMFEQMLGTAEADFYGHQTNHGSFVIGGSSGFETVNESLQGPENTSPMNSTLTVPCICRGIIKYIPRLQNAKIVRTWAGWEDKMVDGVPIIDNVSEVPGLTLACGFSGHGFGISPAVGTVVSELVSGEATSADISGLRYDRFHAKA